MKLFYALLAIASALGTFAAELEVPDRSIEITDLVVAFDKAFLKLRRISFQANVPEQKSYFECEAQSPSADDVLNEIPDRASLMIVFECLYIRCYLIQIHPHLRTSIMLTT